MASIDQILDLAADASQAEIVALIDRLATDHGLTNITVTPTMLERSVDFATRTTTGNTRAALENMSGSVTEAVRVHRKNGQGLLRWIIDAVENTLDEVVDEVIGAASTDPYNDSSYTYDVNLWSDWSPAEAVASKDDETLSFDDAYTWAVKQIGRTLGEVARTDDGNDLWVDEDALGEKVRSFEIIATHQDDSSIRHIFTPNNFQTVING